MEPTKAEVKGRFRAVLPLMKARIVDRSENHFKLAIGGSTTITVACDTRLYDLRDGDLITLYTEVLLAQPQKPQV